MLCSFWLLAVFFSEYNLEVHIIDFLKCLVYFGNKFKVIRAASKNLNQDNAGKSDLTMFTFTFLFLHYSTYSHQTSVLYTIEN